MRRWSYIYLLTSTISNCYFYFLSHSSRSLLHALPHESIHCSIHLLFYLFNLVWTKQKVRIESMMYVSKHLCIVTTSRFRVNFNFYLLHWHFYTIITSCNSFSFELSYLTSGFQSLPHLVKVLPFFTPLIILEWSSRWVSAIGYTWSATFCIFSTPKPVLVSKLDPPHEPCSTI